MRRTNAVRRQAAGLACLLEVWADRTLHEAVQPVRSPVPFRVVSGESAVPVVQLRPPPDQGGVPAWARLGVTEVEEKNECPRTSNHILSSSPRQDPARAKSLRWCPIRTCRRPRCSPRRASPCASCSRPGSTSATDRKSTRLNSSHGYISYAVFCLKKKKKKCG